MALRMAAATLALVVAVAVRGTSAAAAGPGAPPCVADGSTGFEKLVSAAHIEAMFGDWGLSYPKTGDTKTGLAAAEALRNDIACAIRLKGDVFGSFCNTGNRDQDLREAAAFFSNVRKETGGFAKLEEDAPHPYCTTSSPKVSDNLKAAGSAYPCSAGKSYHGRGGIQLSWNFNYGRFSEFLYGDKMVLLENPELVDPSGQTGWAATLWFWMSDQGYGGTAPPDQLNACLATGTMAPHAAFASGQGGMARTINIINGGWECAIKSGYRKSPLARMQSYFDFAGILGVPVHEGCSTVQDCTAKGISLGAHCPLIEVHEAKACPLECGAPVGKDLWLSGGRKVVVQRFTCSDCTGPAPKEAEATWRSQPCTGAPAPAPAPAPGKVSIGDSVSGAAGAGANPAVAVAEAATTKVPATAVAGASAAGSADRPATGAPASTAAAAVPSGNVDVSKMTPEQLAALVKKTEEDHTAGIVLLPTTHVDTSKMTPAQIDFLLNPMEAEFAAKCTTDATSIECTELARDIAATKQFKATEGGAGSNNGAEAAGTDAGVGDSRSSARDGALVTVGAAAGLLGFLGCVLVYRVGSRAASRGQSDRPDEDA